MSQFNQELVTDGRRDTTFDAVWITSKLLLLFPSIDYIFNIQSYKSELVIVNNLVVCFIQLIAMVSNDPDK